jgi:UrcA family protein
MATSAADYTETIVTTTSEGVRSATVSFADLDMDHAGAQDVLHGRISLAARKVCGSSDWRVAGSLQQALENRACYKDSVSQGMSQASSSNQVATISQ